MVSRYPNLVSRYPSCPVELPSVQESTRLDPVIEKYELALLMLFGFAGFSMLIGIAYNCIRQYVFKDFHNLDVVFDAGGRVSVSLTAVTVTSQLLWPADFLQSPTLASKVGISGSLFYTLAIVLSMLVFAVLCIQLKTRAPGAKTFPQIAYARFGKGAHIMFCIVALSTNMVVLANLILAGYITPFVIQTLLGKEGCFVLLTLLTMTLMSTGSGEVMSVSSVLVYDLIKTHIKPFRRNIQPTDCVICGKSKIPVAVDNIPRDLCDCPSTAECKACQADIKNRLSGDAKHGFQYKCSVHGEYRHYEDQLLQYKSWCMIWVIITIIPYGLLIIESGMNLNWAFLASQVFIAPFILPLYFTIGWSKATSMGLLSGGIFGIVCSVSGMLTYGSTYDGGLSNFFTNTAQDHSLLTGLLSGVIVSTVVTVVVSLCDRRFKDKVAFNKHFPLEDTERDEIMKEKLGFLEIEWLKTMSIDNPLNPYRRLYSKELKAVNAGRILTTHHMELIFKKTRLFSIVGVIISFSLFLIVVPAVALSQDVLTEEQLGTWLSVCQHWCLVATVFVVVIPPVQEGIQIWRQYKINRDFVHENTDDVSMHVVI